MPGLLIGLIFVPLLDQALKQLVRERIGTGSFSLGALGEVRLVQSQVWIRQVAGIVPLPAVWVMWCAGAAVISILSLVNPPFGWPLGLILGSAASHVIETTLRGSVSDYVCLRFWPAFNLADVTLSAGTVWFACELIRALA